LTDNYFFLSDYLRSSDVVPGGRIELPTHGFSIFSEFPREIGLYHHPFWGAGRYLRDYCWDSPASLYTFLLTNSLTGLARDYHFTGFPEFTQFYHPALLQEGPKVQSIALPLSYPGIFSIFAFEF